MSVGGSIESLTLDGRTFSVAADADTTRNLGGTDNEVEMNGDGTYRIVKTRVAAKIDGKPLQLMTRARMQNTCKSLKIEKRVFLIRLHTQAVRFIKAREPLWGKREFLAKTRPPQLRLLVQL